MQQPEILNELRRMSAQVGRNIQLVQGAGGNSSIKHGDVLWVKASGTWLADAEDKEIFVPVSLPRARAALAAGNERIPLASGHPEGPLRASIETSLHALMPHRVVLHVHSVNTIAWSVRSDAGDELIARLRGLAWRRLDYHHPGLPLAQAVSESLAQGPADVLILGNHGLVVGAATCEAAGELVTEVERRPALEPHGAARTDHGSLYRICAGSQYRLPQDPLCHTLGTDHHNLAIATKGSLYPDHVVFLGPALPVLSEGENLTTKVALTVTRGYPPPVAVIVPGKGTVIRNDSSAGAEAMLSCLALVTSRLPRNATIKYLSSRDEQALLNWDAEHYRQQMTEDR
ncbi:aldolase [Bradyrhizobium lablabi]|uniref:Aldolase n=1 Tax=Bradyrhizobium lablabi TaxID=722472 RepID=A0A0R3N1T1_9BRAD|nr:class II aldolase/adducin family protein [Bradyrhizobium lablabi]KRR26329.1 aldolase [Bradyrhizobium lablabi]